MRHQILSLLTSLCDSIIPPRETELLVRILTPQSLEDIPYTESGALPYHDPLVRALVWEVKYYANKRAAALCGEVLAEALLELTQDIVGTPLLLPIPMHPTRRRERGHNQTEILAQAALHAVAARAPEGAMPQKKVWKPTAQLWALRQCRACLPAGRDFLLRHCSGMEYSPYTLQRIVHTSQQQGLPQSKRLKNVAKSMVVTDPQKVRGRVCIVLDDVSTTGATFAEATRALKKAGAREVVCVAFAQS